MRINSGVKVLEIVDNIMGATNTIYPTIIWNEDDVILVDAGYPNQLSQILGEMNKIGAPFNNISKIIITHHDIDHIGSLAAVKNEISSKVEVIAHQGEKPYIEGDKRPIKLAYLEANLDQLPEQFKGMYETLKRGYTNYETVIDKVVIDKEVLPYCGGIEIVHTPGHTLGHISVYLKESKTLIAGDLLAVENGVLMTTPKFACVDYEQNIKSLKKLNDYDIEEIICYHGGIFKGNIKKCIEELLISQG